MAPTLEQILAATGGIVFLIVIILVVLLIYVVAMRTGIKAVKGKNTETGAILITALTTFLINVILDLVFLFVPIPFSFLIGIIISLIVIMKRHKTTFFGALGAIIIAFIITMILAVIFIFILILVFAATIDFATLLSLFTNP